ncbi:hypothetical protein WJX81_006615 [Elliptochloris bilobata]|uniref:ATP-dependent DNA helicase n=1 Tax=Elliptochloris bilobata TaxID=381761 RepID=A0AAW1S0R8_9CHLO
MGSRSYNSAFCTASTAIKMDNRWEGADGLFVIHVDEGLDQRRFNAPAAPEVAGVLPGDGTEGQGHRDVRVQIRGGGVHNISDLSAAYMPLHFPLLFPRGEPGWHPGILRGDAPAVMAGDRGAAPDQRTTVTPKEFAAFHLHARPAGIGSDHLLRGTRLLQEYIIDSYCVMEGNNLRYLQNHQRDIRAECYQNLYDAVARGPDWPDITAQLLPGQAAVDRPDVVARVFKLMVVAALEDLLDWQVLGTVVGHTYAIEWQKRGFPHMHLLLIFDDAAHPRSADDYDAIVCAELPDLDTEPSLCARITQCMMHGPCGVHRHNAPCMKDGRCSKHYPREFQEATTDAEGGYPVYRRHDDGRTFVKNGVVLDNRWVVPYNKWLATKYNCHFNVEVVASVKAIKYIHKYTFKGHDCISGEVQRQGIWRVFGFKLHREWPPVYRLALHLSLQQRVHFHPDADLQQVAAAPPQTMLTAWMAKDREDPAARGVLYQDFPKFYVWKKGGKTLGTPPAGHTVVGRIYAASPAQGERFYLRLLLTQVAGAMSFEDLRTVDGRSHIGSLTEDLLHAARQDTGVPDLQVNQAIADIALLQIEGVLEEHKKSLRDAEFRAGDDPMPQISDGARGQPAGNRLVLQERMYDADALQRALQRDLPLLNADQRFAYDAVERALNNPAVPGRAFFPDGPGGTGKTFLYGVLLARVRLLKDLMHSAAPFGGKVVLLDGDFRQVLPVVPKGEAIVSLSADCCERDDDSAVYATESLNSLSPFGLPPHKLVLKARRTRHLH